MFALTTISRDGDGKHIIMHKCERKQQIETYSAIAMHCLLRTKNFNTCERTGTIYVTAAVRIYEQVSQHMTNRRGGPVIYMY